MLFERIQTDLNQALRERNESLVSPLRLLVAAVHNKEIELGKRGQLTDEEVALVVRKEIKQRSESIEAFEKGNRPDLVAKEKAELEILSKYIPQQMTSDQIEKIVKEVINKVGNSSPADFGKVMGLAMSRLKEKADGNQVAQAVKKLLSS